MRSRAIVDLAALRGNYARLIELAGGKVPLLCVVKADAYGHGAVPVSRALVGAGARHLAVGTLEEALELRDSGIGASVVAMYGLQPGEEREAALRGIEPMIGSAGQLARWNETGRGLGRRLSCHLLLNTGMNRLGLDFDPGRERSRERLLEALERSDWIRMRGVATHYGSAEDFTVQRTERQDQLFALQVGALRAAGWRPRYVHAANGAAVVYRGVSSRQGAARQNNMARPGLALYGYVNEPRGRGARPDPQLQPVLEWRARLTRVRELPKGARVGYGSSFVTPRRMRTGVISIGYADGLSWRLSNRGWVAHRGRRCDIIGRVCMDWTMIDLENAPDAREGDEVALLGREPYNAVGMSRLIGGMPYEVLCRLSSRVARQYRDPD